MGDIIRLTEIETEIQKTHLSTVTCENMAEHVCLTPEHSSLGSALLPAAVY